MSIDAASLETLIASIRACCEHRESTAWRLSTIAQGGPPPTLAASNAARVFAFSPTVATAAYLQATVTTLTQGDVGQLHQDLALVELPTAAEFESTATLAREVPGYRGLRRLFRSRPVAGERAVAWMQSLDTNTIHAVLAGIDAKLGFANPGYAQPAHPGEELDPTQVAHAINTHRQAITADLERRTGKLVRWANTQEINDHAAAIAALDQLLATRNSLEDAVAEAARQVTEQQANEEIARTDISVLEQIAGGRLRIGLLSHLSLQQIADSRPDQLTRINGVGEKTATQAIAAARAYVRDVRQSQIPRIDYRNKTPSTPYVLALARLLTFRDEIAALPEDPLRIPHVAPETPVAIAGHVQLLGRNSVHVPPPPPQLSAEDAWHLYAVRAADFHAYADAASASDVPEEVAERISEITLRGTLNASLRGYQSFGAKFALAQKKVLIGDEMGLGKTLQALAVMVHLAALAAKEQRPFHALVVCPPSLRINWEREIRHFTALEPYLIHGPHREATWAAWQERGGIGIVGYPEVRENPRYTHPAIVPNVLVVDEAHRVKNADSKQSKAVHAMTEHTEHVLYLSGTPLENRVKEFITLLTMLDPELDLEDMRVAGFRKAIAGVYLRRNQHEVLAELPELLEATEWVEPNATDVARYRDAVKREHFMDMRQACSGKDSAKMERLLELLDDAQGKTIVFSFFRSVIDALPGLLGDRPGGVHGPIAGGVSHEDRQLAVDAFMHADDGAVLICQITAAAEGLNLQAANHIIIVEPQLNPAIEQQAIARAHRMGQVRAVEVHRLLTPDSVDEQLTTLLAHKRGLFNRYARDSAAADATPEARDITEAQLIEAVIAAERERLEEPPRL